MQFDSRFSFFSSFFKEELRYYLVTNDVVCYGHTYRHSNNREIVPPPSLRSLSRNKFAQFVHSKQYLGDLDRKVKSVDDVK